MKTEAWNDEDCEFLPMNVADSSMFPSRSFLCQPQWPSPVPSGALIPQDRSMPRCRGFKRRASMHTKVKGRERKGHLPFYREICTRAPQCFRHARIENPDSGRNRHTSCSMCIFLTQFHIITTIPSQNATRFLEASH